jgi:hypothetical protein
MYLNPEFYNIAKELQYPAKEWSTCRSAFEQVKYI